ncbi:MAG: hypothetical protein A2931_02925 [Candidatus Niyogibacteria bacterium RIFCSPLOWO2_01_FULL_45_48]|uniref:Uncharacterized protein n=3 Tax=Parcubacteria group TaxID=1794811 RepID=A0A1G2F0G7_9BACT|nr:MAG: hypothetical protein A3B93_00075 [Candidatus Nomurabacteria bacterium RIFCSPHIGHO2_02_FULL_42_24]OGZ28549.1 MAG: hypothetical protein A2835_00440 [Candidatus Niyogibacteria bacterium RIFCSPHIGHO2_01_FULL_45_28]OGZ31100.1 MAG: hypothetical protein A2931_02925 [Candidatus Niyogibacteria bacterium RIFCSPLOWO2_01_FULL_45_48]OGZ31427.1 MAG: hypothetical protein A3J00_02270 [Candidatus Niyogibacteria bacterium RIFCSPLOWO2_02_FULL_45_13]
MFDILQQTIEWKLWGWNLVTLTFLFTVLFTLDDSPEDELDFSGNTAVEHPVFVKFYRILNAILKKEYGIERGVPKRSDLFQRSGLAVLFGQCGLMLKRFHHKENVISANPLDANLTAFPMLMGGVNLPFETKIKLGRRVHKELSSAVTEKDLMTPMRSQQFFQVFEKI